MRKNVSILISLMALVWSCDSVMDSGSSPTQTQQSTQATQTQESAEVVSDADLWIGAYLASWNHYVEPTGNWGNLPGEAIDFDAFSHLYYFALSVQSDGTLSPIEPYENFGPDRVEEAVQLAHENEVPILFSVGGWGNDEGFSSAIEPENRDQFIQSLLEVLTEWDFDGIDLDMEPIRDSDVENYSALVRELSAELDQLETPMTDRPYLTAAVMGSHENMFADLQEYFDQINLMTYDFSGAWQGWVSWHNSNLFNGGATFPGMNKELPSTEREVEKFLNAGVEARKLGIGIDFYGYVWHGQVDAPRQEWDSAPDVEDNVPYHQIMDEYYSDELYNWDDEAVAPYLSIESSDPSQRKFISYDDERLIQEKVNYIREKGIGGAIIWELGGGYRADQPAGERDPLLQAVKEAVLNPEVGGIEDPEPGKPEVTVVNPGEDTEVSGTTTIQVETSGAVSSVQFRLDGRELTEVTSIPYDYDWATGQYGDGPAVLEAVASNDNGESDRDAVEVIISNEDDSLPPEEDPEGLVIYENQLASPWSNASWSADVDFGNQTEIYTGDSAIRVDQDTWGGFSLIHGSWGNLEDIPLMEYEHVTFTVYPEGTDAEMEMVLENSAGYSFPRISVGEAPADQWTVFSVPVEELNPNGHEANRIGLMESSGTSLTYYVDRYQLADSDSETEPEPEPEPEEPEMPVLASPEDGALISGNRVELSWDGESGIYEVQIATDDSFSQLEAGEEVIGSSWQTGELNPGDTYSWRVRADESGVYSDWSQSRSFTIEEEFVESEPEIGILDIKQRTTGPWSRVHIYWEVEFPGGTISSVRSELLDTNGAVLDVENTSLDSSYDDDEHNLRTRGNEPDAVRVIVTDSNGGQVVETRQL